MTKRAALRGKPARPTVTKEEADKNPFAVKPPAKPYTSPRAGRGRPHGAAPGRGNRPDRWGNVKLAVSVGILAAVMLIRVFDPRGAADMRGAVDTYIGGDRSAVTIEALGQAISESESIAEVFANLSDVFNGRWQSTPVDNPDDAREPGSDTADEPADEAPASAAASAADEPAEDQEETDGIDPPRQAVMENAAIRLLAVFPPLPLSEEEAGTGAYGVDDTPPVPFGMSVPDDVDYTAYDLPFEYAEPVSGVKSSGFGYRKHPIAGETLFHHGTDFAAPSGTDIHCFADGKVTARGVSGTYGNYFMVSHGHGVSSFYAHCGKISVKVGDGVTKGQVVAKVGSTGLSTGPHLHFELRRDSAVLNPEHYL